MIDKKDKLLGKFVKKDYNNELEEILDTKNYEEDVKSLLLSMCYKIETAYKDYEKVKRNVLSKDKYIKMIISVIQKDCDSIKFVSKDLKESMENKTFIVDKQKKEIICYPIEKKLLYTISKIHKKENIVKSDDTIINKTISNMLNIGNNINTCEPLRDFNGFSWNIVYSDIENLMYNVVYQDLILLASNQFFEDWINNNKFVMDYFEIFENELEEKYGTNLKEKIITNVISLSILLELETNEEFRDILEKEKEKVEKEYEKFKNKEKYILDLTNKKKNITKKIKKIDQTINDKALLDEEYEKRNKKLPLEKKIFSMKVLKKIMTEEREELFKKIEECSKLMNPQNFIKKQSNIKEKLYYYSLVDNEDIDSKIYEYILNLQKNILDTFKIKAEKLAYKNEIINLLYEFRYYSQIPIERGKTVGTIADLQDDFFKTQKVLIDLAIKKKAIIEISSKEEINVEVLKNIFATKIILLENISIKLIKEKDIWYVQIFDEEIAERKIKIEGILEKKDLKVKTNKKLKLLI